MPFTDTHLSLENLAPGESRCVEAGAAQVAVFREADTVFAIDNICPHRGAPLHEGFVRDGYVTCPWHQWQFQLNDGVCRNIPKVRVAHYPVEVRDGAIWVDVPTTEGNLP
jgi:NAD(P)H-dependent nitrite reductase small subunit